MLSIKELINKKKPQGLDEKTLLFLANKVIERAFGKVGRENIVPEKIISKTLILRSSGSLWASEMWLRRHEIASGINREAGDEVIEKIKVS
jgi:hypothetical protein